MIHQFHSLFDNTVTSSQLALDPLSDSYYLMLVTTIDLPKLLGNYVLFNNLVLANTLPSANETKLSKLILAAEIRSKIADITLSLKKISDENDLLKKYKQTNLDLLSKLEREISTEIDALKNNGTISDNGVITQSALASSNKEGLVILKTILEERVKALSSSLLTSSIFAALFLMIMIYCVIGFIESLKQSIAILSESIKDISSGNLVREIIHIGNDELSDILVDMEVMQVKLSDMIKEISNVSGALNSSAHEIASGNNNLSERTQEQASCLVETSASLNNLTDTIKKNSLSAADALTLATTATDFALKGGEAVNNVITTMGNIDESSQKIQEITSIIDGIAFQTNLLALNASVEAARAGEQGRGFAVVASEVRNLAQRSADAAKQIKYLINDSMTKVASGDAQVKITWSTMQDIVRSIEHVNQTVEKIATESKEQSLSIEQINIVISQLEGNTQKNAAQVEEVAASAELLSEQSNKLVNIVNQFEVE
ncbi:methyl-accepting chemotaxis protein [Legionella sp. km772]|uniref:methyl-accepting chemotaxis protein n=1 Tax=Legionella sp. km772 TaxID=2498111 RepID=UPI000F8E8AB0|nr:methyl-accepting chemotaxis protein [Legionella sp. km772]RUR13288.1 hypothetical protein ELY15_02840 [Legionella sp. km772]